MNNRLLLKPPGRRPSFEATVTEDGIWSAPTRALEQELTRLASKYWLDARMDYKLPHIHLATMAVCRAWPDSEVLAPIVTYPQVHEDGSPIVY